MTSPGTVRHYGVAVRSQRFQADVDAVVETLRLTAPGVGTAVEACPSPADDDLLRLAMLIRVRAAIILTPTSGYAETGIVIHASRGYCTPMGAANICASVDVHCIDQSSDRELSRAFRQTIAWNNADEKVSERRPRPAIHSREDVHYHCDDGMNIMAGAVAGNVATPYIGAGV